MAAPEVAIRRMATRIRAPEPEDAFAARALLEHALRRMGPGVDAALERAGLPPDAVFVLPRMTLRLHLRGEVSAAELGEAWAEALAQAILSALPAPRDAAAPQDAPGIAEAESPASFRDLWAAEMAVLQAIARGEPAPWWTAEIIGETPGTAPRVLAEILVRWITRDPARAARRMSAVLTQMPLLAAELDARVARTLALRLLETAQAALNALAPAIPGGPGSGMPPQLGATPAARDAAAQLLSLLPGPLRIALASLAPAQRTPWLTAAVLAHAPAQAAQLAALLETAAGLPVPVGDAPRPSEGAAPAPKPSRLADAVETEASEVWCGGLLLMVRPLARLRPAWLSLGTGLADRLLALGLLALQRLAAPLPPAARRAALERDRPLLAVFAGTTPPDEPLDEVRLAPLLVVEAEDALAALLAAAPPGAAHAPAALRRAYGRDFFVADAATDALCRLLLRPGRLLLEDGAATLVWPPDAADIALRRAGWDIDPGWVPWLGRRIAFRYGA